MLKVYYNGVSIVLFDNTTTSIIWCFEAWENFALEIIYDTPVKDKGSDKGLLLHMT